jgi:hypothetical protein
MVIYMKAIFKARSQNGRWGMQIVCAHEREVAPARTGDVLQGSLKPLGRSAGTDCFEFVPIGKGGDPETFIVIGSDLDQVQGPAKTVLSLDLQGNDQVTILVARPGACWKSYGYKRRGSSWQMLTADGTIETPPVGVLLAAGIIQPIEVPAEDVVLPPEPDEESPMRRAMREAGLI